MDIKNYMNSNSFHFKLIFFLIFQAKTILAAPNRRYLFYYFINFKNQRRHFNNFERRRKRSISNFQKIKKAQHRPSILRAKDYILLILRQNQF